MQVNYLGLKWIINIIYQGTDQINWGLCPGRPCAQVGPDVDMPLPHLAVCKILQHYSTSYCEVAHTIIIKCCMYLAIKFYHTCSANM